MGSLQHQGAFLLTCPELVLLKIYRCIYKCKYDYFLLLKGMTDEIDMMITGEMTEIGGMTDGPDMEGMMTALDEGARIDGADQEVDPEVETG